MLARQSLRVICRILALYDACNNLDITLLVGEKLCCVIYYTPGIGKLCCVNN